MSASRILVSKDQPDNSGHLYFTIPASAPDDALTDVRCVAGYCAAGVSTVWRWLAEDPDFPKPIRLSSRCTRWNVGAVRRYVAAKFEQQGGE